MLTTMQKKAAECILNLFETSEVLGDYGKVTVIPDDRSHHSFGRSQTTLGSGNLFKEPPACKAFYARLKALGKPAKVINVAIAHKLLRQAFAVATTHSSFSADYALFRAQLIARSVATRQSPSVDLL